MKLASHPTTLACLLLLGVSCFAAPAGAQLTDLGAHVLTECAAPGDCLANEFFGDDLAVCDFDDDGFADLAVGVAEETVGPNDNAGSLHIFYGSTVGLSSAGEQVFDLDDLDLSGGADVGDRLGSALVAGDFDRDGFCDLAAGAPGKSVGAPGNHAGAVVILFGSASGLTGNGFRFLSQNHLPPGSSESAEENDEFGAALAVLPNGGLAIGVPREDFFEPSAGLVHLLSTSEPGSALDSVTDREQNDFLDVCADGNESEDLWGSTLVVGRFGASPSLVVAGALEDHSGFSNAGRVTVIGAPDDCFDQNTSGIVDAAEADDLFGEELAAGDFDGDGFDDLAIGVAGEDTASTGGDTNGGAVHVLFGRSGGLTTSGDLFFDQFLFPLNPVPGDRNDHFGDVLASGDFDGDGFDDLAIGVPDEDVDAIASAGTVHVSYGGDPVFSEDENQTFHSDFPAGMPDSPNPNDAFGQALAAGDFDGNGTDDLAIGMPGEDLGTQGQAGAVTVLYGLDGSNGGFGTAHFNSATASFPEDPGTRIVVILRDGSAVLSASVEHSRTGGSATPGVDFNYTPGVSSWAVGDLGFEIFGIQILGDTLDENSETIVLHLSNPSPGLGLGSPSTLTFAIQDDDEGGVVQFQVTGLAVNESSATATAVVVRNGGAASGVTVQYATSNGSAVAGEDFVAETGTLSFGAGVSSQQIEIALLDDPTDEPAESFTLTLSNATGGANLGAQTTMSIGIVDDDPAGQIFLDGFESGDTSRWSSTVG